MLRQFVTFRLGEALFGVDVLLVDEINRQLDMVPVAGAPEHVCGLLNLRGQIVSVIDLGHKIGLGPQPRDAASRCVVLKTARTIRHLREEGLTRDDTGPDTIGLLVGRVEDMVAVEAQQLDPAPANVGDIAGRFIEGVAQLDGDLLIVVRLREVVAFEPLGHQT